MSHLTPPLGSRDHTQGPPGARVTLVEYGDFECPHCGAAYPVVNAIQQAMGSKLLFAYRHFPLSRIHLHAEHAAEMAEAAAEHGKFWEMHDLLFEHQTALEPDDLRRYAKKLDLDVGALDQALASGAPADRVRHWTLDVGRWMFDVFPARSGCLREACAAAQENV